MRKLKADEIECRVAQVTAKGCSLLLYKTARTDAAILTEIYGDLWQNDYKVIDGKMYGGIGVWNKELSQWIWRWDCGVESNTEAEKGQASDSFKRAGFKFLIGQELYKAPFIFIQCETIKDGTKYKLKNPYIKYQVTEIGYADNGDINKLKIKNSNNEVVFELGKYVKPETKEKITDDDKLMISGVMECQTIKALEDYYKEISPMLSSNNARMELVKECKKAKEKLNG